MKSITELDAEYTELRKGLSKTSDEILEHLHSVYDDKLATYKSIQEFLDDINEYAGGSLGKIMYINYVHNYFNMKNL